MTPLLDLNSRKPMAVGSTFKLAVLGELKDQINSGRLNWLSMIALENMDRSLPSGTLQNAPTGSQHSLQDLARRMIADSDNTATNTLLRILGRSGIGRRIGQASIPNTREAFILKAAENSDLLRAYRSALGDQQLRSQILSRAAQRILPAPQSVLPRPTALDVEWFMTTRKACELMGQVSQLNETTINPGVVDQRQFQRVSFKGGSEPGVLNLTTQVINKENKTYCVSASWNNVKGLDEVQFTNFYRGIVELLK
nr:MULTISPECIES: serine hydrolase [unclassified Deinococcus]